MVQGRAPDALRFEDVIFRVREPPAPRRPAGSRRTGVALAIAFVMLIGALGTSVYVLALTLSTPASVAGGSGLAAAGTESAHDGHTPVPVDGNYHLTFKWAFSGRDYTWTMDIPVTAYNYFHGLERPVRYYQDGHSLRAQQAYDVVVSDPNDDAYIGQLANTLLVVARQDGLSSDQTLSLALAFVQSLPYTSDRVTTGFDEYSRYPLETLVDGGGDCEDSAILYASLVQAMGYGAVLINPPGHVAVGVAVGPEVSGASYQYNGTRYVYAETTGDGWTIGEIPDEFVGVTANILDLTPKPLFTLHVQFGAVAGGRQHLDLLAKQTGSASATSVQIVAQVTDGLHPYDTQQCALGTVLAGASVSCALDVDLRSVPRGKTVQIVSQVQDTNYWYDRVESQPWIPRR